MSNEPRSQILTAEQRERFARLGFLAAIDVLSGDEVRSCAERLTELFAREAREGEPALRHPTADGVAAIARLIARPSNLRLAARLLRARPMERRGPL